jgi:hypothetical protein
MTRTELIEAMARAAWEALDEPELWRNVPESMRRDWVGYQEAAVTELETLIPAVRDAIDAATS